MNNNGNSWKAISPKVNTYAHEQKIRKMYLDAGWLGRIFGTGSNAASNIAGFIAIITILTGIIFTYFNWPVNEFWKVVVLPITTLVLGYIFGKQN